MRKLRLRQLPWLAYTFKNVKTSILSECPDCTASILNYYFLRVGSQEVQRGVHLYNPSPFTHSFSCLVSKMILILAHLTSWTSHMKSQKTRKKWMTHCDCLFIFGGKRRRWGTKNSPSNFFSPLTYGIMSYKDLGFLVLCFTELLAHCGQFYPYSGIL